MKSKYNFTEEEKDELLVYLYAQNIIHEAQLKSIASLMLQLKDQNMTPEELHRYVFVDMVNAVEKSLDDSPKFGSIYQAAKDQVLLGLKKIREKRKKMN